MQRETPKRNFAARVGMWSARHRKTAIIGWFTFVLLAFALGNGLGLKELDQSKAGSGESGRATEIIGQNWPQEDDKAVESVLVSSKSQSVKSTDPKFRAAVADVTKQLNATPHVANVKSPYAPGNGPTQISKDGHTVRVDFEVPGTDKLKQEKDVEDSIKTVSRAPEVALRPAGRAVRQRKRGQGAQRGADGRFPEGGEALDSAHPDHPGHRVRRVRGRRYSRSCSRCRP